MSVWFSMTAHISAVCARTVSFALTFAPRSSSTRDRVGLAGAGCRHQRGFAAWRRGVRIGAGVEQRAEHRRIAVGGGEADRRDAVPVRHLHVRAGLDQRCRRS